MPEQFVCEFIKPVTGTSDTSAMSAGGPGLPEKFLWRDKLYEIDEVIEKWKETSPCRHGSQEQYVRKHWYKILTTSGDVMKLYFDRQVRSKREAMKRWWLYTLSKGPS